MKYTYIAVPIMRSTDVYSPPFMLPRSFKATHGSCSGALSRGRALSLSEGTGEGGGKERGEG